jgi:thiosulfate/3-mercaptopyruvate sulfurtransferase
LRSGHITGSKNLPFTELVDATTGCLKSDKELSKIFLEKGIDTTVPTINSCGSGMTACVLDLGLSIMGAEKSSIYDGSWTEYVSLSI